jgi:hypothetical protein
MPDIFLSISTSLFPPPPILLGWYDDEGRDLSLISARVLAVSVDGLNIIKFLTINEVELIKQVINLTPILQEQARRIDLYSKLGKLSKYRCIVVCLREQLALNLVGYNPLRLRTEGFSDTQGC